MLKILGCPQNPYGIISCMRENPAIFPLHNSEAKLSYLENGSLLRILIRYF
jgi:hypothetical protein